MKILDLTAGRRAIWFDKQNPLCTYLDIREEMNPDIVCDTRSIPDGICDIDLVVYDPPHMCCGPNSNMAKSYGHFKTADILDSIKGSGKEAHRVTRPNALMALKWNDHDIRLERVLDLLVDWKPLFGHRLRNMSGISKKRRISQSYWVLLLRRGEE